MDLQSIYLGPAPYGRAAAIIHTGEGTQTGHACQRSRWSTNASVPTLIKTMGCISMSFSQAGMESAAARRARHLEELVDEFVDEGLHAEEFRCVC